MMGTEADSADDDDDDEQAGDSRDYTVITTTVVPTPGGPTLRPSPKVNFHFPASSRYLLITPLSMESQQLETER